MSSRDILVWCAGISAGCFLLGVALWVLLRKKRSRTDRSVFSGVAGLIGLLFLPAGFGEFEIFQATFDVGPSVGTAEQTNVHEVVISSVPSVLFAVLVVKAKHPEATHTGLPQAQQGGVESDTSRTARIEPMVAAENFGLMEPKAFLRGSGVTVVAVTKTSSFKLGEDITHINGRSVFTRTDMAWHLTETRPKQWRITGANYGERIVPDLRGLDVVSASDFTATIARRVTDSHSTSGDSSGLAFALGTLIANHTIAKPPCRVVVTGALTYDANVVGIGGVKQKAYGAGQARACLFIVPRYNYAEAVAEAKVPVVGVCTLSEAVSALRNVGKTIPPMRSREHCDESGW
jgi:Lon protease (S16) C-terminal proteolytic domain